MTIILETMNGNASTQVNHTNDVEEAIKFATQYGHECTGKFKRVAEEVDFSWDFEDCGEEGVIKMISITLDCEKFDSYITEAGRFSIPDARRAAKRLAKDIGAVFVESTIPNTSKDYRASLMENINTYR